MVHECLTLLSDFWWLQVVVIPFGYYLATNWLLFDTSSTTMLARLASHKVSKVAWLGLSVGVSGWFTYKSGQVKSLRCKVTSQSDATKAYREAPPKDWAFYRFSTKVHVDVIENVLVKSNGVVIVDPTGEDLSAIVQFVCTDDARRLVYLERNADIKQRVSSELWIDELEDLQYFKGELLIVVNDVFMYNKMDVQSVQELTKITTKLPNIRVVILTRDPIVAKNCRNDNVVILYDTSNKTLSEAYVDYKIGGTKEPELKKVLMRSNSPSLVDFVSKQDI